MKAPYISSVVAVALLVGLAGCQSAGGPAPAASAPAPAPAKAANTPPTREVKGLNGYTGEITGTPAPGSRFTSLQIGMPRKQAYDIVGTPSDQGTYITGKAFIPYFWGADRYRHEAVYKGQGRLIFAGGSVGDWSNSYLIWIIHDAKEAGYR